jgi:O-methyltransferase involved in polyketide biosynthesis
MADMNSTKLKSLGFTLVFTLAICAAAAACPTCKDNLANDPAAANLVRGYAYSIMFMLSMPPLIFGSLCAYFYWEVRKAKARAARISAESGPVAAPQS